MTIEQIWEEARIAATEAGNNAKPTAVVFGMAKGLTGNDMVPGTEELCTEGVCGFAWIKISGRGKLATFVKANGYAHKGVYGGYEIFSSSLYANNTQSMERKEEAMSAAQKVFEKHGITATVYSRMD